MINVSMEFDWVPQLWIEDVCQHHLASKISLSYNRVYLQNKSYLRQYSIKFGPYFQVAKHNSFKLQRSDVEPMSYRETITTSTVDRWCTPDEQPRTSKSIYVYIPVPALKWPGSDCCFTSVFNDFGALEAYL